MALSRPPLHERVRVELERLVTSLEVGSKVPSELELTTQLGVSRTTIREAIRSLEEEGLIEKRRGVGTFVCERTPKLKAEFQTIIHINDVITRAGKQPRVAHHSIGEGYVPPNPQHLPDGKAALFLERVYAADDEPVVTSTVYFLYDHPDVERRLKEIKPDQMLSNADGLFGEKPVRVHTHYGVALSTADISGRLDIKVGTPLLRISRWYYAQEQQEPIFCVIHHLNTQHFELSSVTNLS